MGKPSIFISYSRKDTEFVKRLAADLELAGYDPWWDVADLRGGQAWAAEIEKHVRACDAAVIVLSPDSNRSEWVGKETLLALELKKTIIPAKWRESELPLPLVDRQFVDFRDRYDEALRDLCQALPPGTASIRPGPPAKSTASIYMVLAAVAAIVVLGGLIWKFLLRPASPTPMPAQAVPMTSTAVLPTRFSEAATPPTAALPPTATLPPIASPSLAATPLPVVALPPTATPPRTTVPSPTATSLPTPPTPPPTSTQPACAIAAGDTFLALWQQDRARLGCALNEPAQSNAAAESFQRGRMIWRENNRMIYVLHNDGDWAAYPDVWVDGTPEPGGFQAPSGLYTPVRGFGTIWRRLGGTSARLGWATGTEGPVSIRFQDFEKGLMLEMEGKVYLLGDNGGLWLAP